MSKVAKCGSIWKMAEAVQSRLECSGCDVTINSYDDDSYELAEKAHGLGWRGFPNGDVLCPKCSKK